MGNKQRIIGLWFLALGALTGCASTAPDGESDAAATTARPVVQATSLTGTPLTAPPLSDEARLDRQQQYDDARAAVDAAPEDVDAIIWVGRRAAYLGRYREAIEIFSRGLTVHPDDARLYRHRGHRYVTTRQLDAAIADFQRAAALTDGQPDQVEPDGLPNARGIPTSTLQTNIWYHLGLAHFVRGELDQALDAYERCEALSANPDMRVATVFWLVMTLDRLGRTSDAEGWLQTIDADLDIIENTAYHRLLLLYAGTLSIEDIAPETDAADPALEDATLGHGIGHWHFRQGRADDARATWERVVAGGNWPAFGYLAAQARLLE